MTLKRLMVLVWLALLLKDAKGFSGGWSVWSNHTYFISDWFDLSLELTYTEASLYCQNLSSHLASVHSQKETDFLKENRRTLDAAWLGLHHTQTSVPTGCNCSKGCSNIDPCRGDDKWYWEDGTDYDWTKWHSDQPTGFTNEDQEELCARFHGDGKWYDDVCSIKHYFICKKAINCFPHFCNQNGMCDNNICVCDKGFTGETCGSDLKTNCYPHFCSLHGICENNQCVCNSGYTGEICDTIVTTTVPTLIEKLITVTESQSPGLCNCQEIISPGENQTAGESLAAPGVVLGISLIVNIVISVKLLLDQRNKHTNKKSHPDEHVYYNSVMKPSRTADRTKEGSGGNSEHIVQTRRSSNGDTGSADIPDNQDIKDPYERVNVEDIRTNRDETATYAELQ